VGFWRVAVDAEDDELYEREGAGLRLDPEERLRAMMDRKAGGLKIYSKAAQRRQTHVSAQAVRRAKAAAGLGFRRSVGMASRLSTEHTAPSSPPLCCCRFA